MILLFSKIVILGALWLAFSYAMNKFDNVSHWSNTEEL